MSAAAILAMPVTAQAGTSSAGLSIQMNVTASCTVGSLTQDFGAVVGTSLLSVFVDNNASLSVTCTNGSPYSVGIDNGSNASGSQRRLANGTSYINYNLYQDALHLSPWGGNSTATSCSSFGGCYLGTGNGSAQSITIYGHIPLLVVAPASGTYSDSITVNIDY